MLPDAAKRCFKPQVGRERVHFVAPAAARLDDEMAAFLDWCNGNTPAGLDEVLKAALAHLWFVTIHPFEDGNGRIARTIADMMLARSEKSPLRFYSMSAQIRIEREDYYAVLERTQKGATLEVTGWMAWFFGCLGRAIEAARAGLADVLERARVWENLAAINLNDRQRRVIPKLLEGFEGKLTSSKWAAPAKTSPDTALRDIQHLVEHGVLVRNEAGGRSTSYRLAAMEAAGKKEVGEA